MWFAEGIGFGQKAGLSSGKYNGRAKLRADSRATQCTLDAVVRRLRPNILFHPVIVRLLIADRCPSLFFGKVHEILKVHSSVADETIGKDRAVSYRGRWPVRFPNFKAHIMDLKKIVVLGGVAVASAAVGIVLPRMMGPAAPATAKADVGHAPATGHEPEKAPEKKADDGHGASADHGKAAPKVIVPPDTAKFVEFGRIVVNLNEPLLTKFLSLDISVQTQERFREDVTMSIEANKKILNTWLTSHLADKTIEDIRGKVGVNRLRREIQDNFNRLLFKDGRERVQDILFEEYHVQ